MKALTIRQPFASLLVNGEKRFETTRQTTKYRGPIAIHAAFRLPTKNNSMSSATLRRIEAVTGMSLNEMLKLPYGRIIATAELSCVWEIADEGGRIVARNGISSFSPAGKELQLGAWHPGFYAWEFTNIQPLEFPVPVIGRAKLWNWEGETIA